MDAIKTDVERNKYVMSEGFCATWINYTRLNKHAVTHIF